jgi:hypothetical protein
MSANRASIGQVTMVVAIAAVNLAILRPTPREFVTYPTLWVLLGAIDLVIFWKLVGKRSLQAFHYPFLIVFVIAFVVMANFAATGRLQPLGLLVGWYQQLSGGNTIPLSRGMTWISLTKFNGWGRFHSRWTARNRCAGAGPMPHRIIRRALQPCLELRPVMIQDGHELIVFDISESTPEMILAQEAEMGEQLTQSYVR